MRNKKDQKGVAAIPTVLALAILMVAIVAAITTIAFSESFMSLGASQSAKALRYAEAGARDALMRIARDKTYACDAPADGCYQIPFVTNGCSVNDGCAKITVSAAAAPKVIVSTGQVKNNIRTVRVSVAFDGSGNGEITSAQWEEVTD